MISANRFSVRGANVVRPTQMASSKRFQRAFVNRGQKTIFYAQPKQEGLGMQPQSQQIPDQVIIKPGSQRTLLIKFNCSKCDGVTQRLVNPRAWNKGTVFVQCANCQTWHKLKDNLNLIQEFKLQKQKPLDFVKDKFEEQESGIDF